MKKILFLVLVSFMWTVALMAEPVTPSQAREKVSQFLKKRVASHARRSAPIAVDLKMMAAGKDDSYYIFNVGDEGGYVVVSGDDATEEILGYSDTGSINPDNMPCGMRVLLDNYVSQIQFLRENRITREQNTRARKANHEPFQLDGNRLARYYQFDPYNLECPQYGSILSRKTAATGCAATAMAQLMYYHKWPNATTKTIPSYTTTAQHFEREAIPSNTIIDWENILRIYNQYDEEGNITKISNDDQDEAIANLMKYAGSSICMDYAQEGRSSGAPGQNIPYALNQFFGYDESICFKYRRYYSSDAWDDMLYNELSNNGPIIYFGYSDNKEEPEEGHGFMLEGYNGDGYYYINFGWDGQDNNWFLLDLVNGKFNFIYSQGAVFNARPSSNATTSEIPLHLFTEKLQPYNSYVFLRNSDSQLFENISLWIKTANYMCTNFSYGYGFRFVDSNNTKFNYHFDSNYDIDFSEYTQGELVFNYGNNLSDGKYKIYGISKESSASDWQLNDNSNNEYIDAIICNDKLAFKFTGEDITLLNLFDFLQTSEAPLRVGQPSEFTYVIENIISSYVDLYDGYIFAVAEWKEGDVVKEKPIFIDEIQVLPQEKSKIKGFTFTPLVAGEQDIVFYNKEWDEIGRQTVTAISATTLDFLEVTDMTLVNGDFKKGFIDGTILSGTLYVKNNDVETIEEEVIIGLEDVESPLASKTKSISVSINPNCVEGYDIRFYNLTANHRYVITASHVTGEEFYRSPVLLCKAGYEIETYPSMYSEYQVLNEPYVETNMSAFKTNMRVAGDRIWNAINKYQSHGIVAKKADLVGHSMGGVLSRLHVQYAIGGTENVHKVITVNTPHSGSPLGDIFRGLSSSIENNGNKWKKWRNLFDEFMGWDSRYNDIDMQAVSDLGYNSDQTDEYLNNPTILDKMNTIPIHAIVTDATEVSESDIESFLNKEEDWRYSAIVQTISNLGLSYVWNEDEITDQIVSAQSQLGGLESPCFSIIHDQWHIGSPNNVFVQDTLISLLHEPVGSVHFCKTGFRPVDLVWKEDENTGSWVKKYQAQQTEESASTRRRVYSLEPMVTALVKDNVLTASMIGSEGFDYKTMLVQFGKDGYRILSGTQIECEVPASFSGDATVYGIVRMEGEDILWSKTQVNIPTPRASRASISASALSIYYDEAQPVSLTCTWSDGSETRVLPDVISFMDNLAHYENGYVTGLHAGSGTATFGYEGLTCEVPFTVYNFGKKDDEESSQSVCSTITLKLSQTMTMTRQAFRGTLTMFNGNEAMSMKDVKLALKITNVTTGEVATAHEFQINPESIEGFTGEVDLSSGWTLAGNATGKATVLFIPTKYAAPTEPVEWSFGGTLSYLDPFTGLEVTRDLYPVTLTVKPSPELDLDYFLQRDVFGDDPLTEEVEPMQPAEFALLINNKGYGDATNVRMVTQQPQIIDNEKGLLIDFELLSSQVNGSDKTLAFGQSIANDFGTIDAQSQAYAQWWLQSSLLGHFTEYSVKANHVTSYGNEDLSLLDQVNIHELIHGFTPTSGGRGFLVNDIVDAADMPDRIYFTDATQESVSIATNATLTKQGDDYLLTVMPTQTGWNYGSLIDPTDGKKEITSIIRQSDGVEIPLDNIWRTDRTLRDGKDPIVENRLHLVSNILSDSESYLLSFTPREEVSNVVTGHVAAQTENGQPVVGATVTLCSGDVVYTTTTDGAGYFTLKVDETSLDYVMTCTAEGFIDGAEKEVRFLGDAVKCNYTLMPGATIKIPASGICTYSSVVGLDFSQATLPVKAYYGKRYDTERVIIDELTTAAANEGLVLMGQPNSRVDVPEAVNVAPLAENVLYGTAFAPYTVTSDDVYVLANKTGKPKFHQAAQGLVIPKNKAYLLLFIGEFGSKGIDVIFDEATLIDMIRSAENRENHYGIDGIRIGETVKGIHVVKGKKLIVK